MCRSPLGPGKRIALRASMVQLRANLPRREELDLGVDIPEETLPNEQVPAEEKDEQS